MVKEDVEGFEENLNDELRTGKKSNAVSKRKRVGKRNRETSGEIEDAPTD